jgi:hypothetical protein
MIALTLVAMSDIFFLLFWFEAAKKQIIQIPNKKNVVKGANL